MKIKRSMGKNSADREARKIAYCLKYGLTPYKKVKRKKARASIHKAPSTSDAYTMVNDDRLDGRQYKL